MREARERTRARAEGRVAERVSAADTRRVVMRKASKEAASERDMRDRKFAGVTA